MNGKLFCIKEWDTIMSKETKTILTVGSGVGIPSLTTQQELDYVYRLSKDTSLPDGDVLELGVAYGGTSHIIAHGNEERGRGENFYMVDLLTDLDEHETIIHLCYVAFRVCKIFENSYFSIGDIECITKLCNSPRFRFVFIDANHTYEALKHDVERVLPLVVKGGLISLHDIHGEIPGMIDVWNEIGSGVLFSGDVTQVESCESIGTLRRL
jgi:cephalosporin hydroxylase